MTSNQGKKRIGTNNKYKEWKGDTTTNLTYITRINVYYKQLHVNKFENSDEVVKFLTSHILPKQLNGPMPIKLVNLELKTCYQRKLQSTKVSLVDSTKHLRKK